eukprot:scaffold2808_cov255-Pinguiococcus_pyrenoidosus.AAC.42
MACVGDSRSRATTQWYVSAPASRQTTSSDMLRPRAGREPDRRRQHGDGHRIGSTPLRGSVGQAPLERPGAHGGRHARGFGEL